ncbi:MAG: winged helix-turn-helix transcriptional regulator [Candidatus Lokiarchaeota archaeon]|nr:winged helix-turn-helix transcriptional regulator [Candidatus Lokiarchaeota archaeon]
MSELRKYIVEFLKVLAHPTRLEILDLLKNSEQNSSEIQNLLNRSQSTVSKHLSMLFENNIIDFEKKDNTKYYKIKNSDIFTLISNINVIVGNVYKEKFKDIRDVDVYDILS